MKKLVSFIILVITVFMLEFNFFSDLLPEAHAWVETLLAFAALIGILAWNGMLKKTT